MLERRVRLTLGSPDTGEGIVIEDLRVDFEVKKLMGGAPNTALIKVFNLAPERRALVDREYTKAVLEVGDANSLSVIFIGQLYNALSGKSDGKDIVTQLFCGSGLNAYQNATVHASFEAGTALREIVGVIAGEFEDLGVGVGPLDEIALLEGTSVGRGSVFSGAASDMLDKVLENTGLSWSITDDKLEILRNETQTTSTIFVTPEQGLIDSPKRTQIGYDFTSVLNPAIRAGVTVGVFSEFVQSSEQALHFIKVRSDNGGFVRPISVAHKGTNYKGPATTEVVGIR